MTDLDVNTEILIGLGVELSRIGAALEAFDTPCFQNRRRQPARHCYSYCFCGGR